MAEVLGVISAVSSIAGLVDVAARVSMGLLSVAKAIGSAGQEIRAIARHTSIISSVLNNLHTVMNQGASANTTLLRGEIIVEDTLSFCKEILGDCERLVKIFQPLVEKKGKKRERVALRVRMLFEKSKFVAHGDALDKLTGVLNLLVTSMNYSHATRSNIAEEDTILASCRIQVESSITNVEDSWHSRLNVTQLLTYHRSYELKTHLLTPDSEYFHRQRKEENSLMLIDMDDSLLASSHSQPDITQQESVRLTRDELDVNNIHSCKELARVGNSNSESDAKTAASDTSKDTSSIDESCEDEDLDRELEEAFGFDNVEDLLEPYMALKSLQKKSVQFAQAILDYEITNEDKEAAAAAAFSDAKDDVSVITDSLRTGADSRTGSDEYDDELEVLRLRDVRGQIFNLPFQYARTWEGVNVLLLEIYEHSPEYINPVKLSEQQKDLAKKSSKRRYGRGFYRHASSSETDKDSMVSLKPFQLYGPDGNPILPRVWPQVVVPGELITMRFYDEKLNGVGAHPVTLVQRGMVWARSWWWSGSQNGLARRIPEPGQKDRVRFVRANDEDSSDSRDD